MENKMDMKEILWGIKDGKKNNKTMKKYIKKKKMKENNNSRSCEI